MNDLRPFRFWCQKVLPLVYDDELSYYELLCKVVDYLNKTMENVNRLSENFDELQSAFNILKDYVNNYFKNLDVQEEINKKLDEMAKNGELSILLNSSFINIFATNNVQSVSTLKFNTSGYTLQSIASITDNIFCLGFNNLSNENEGKLELITLEPYNIIDTFPKNGFENIGHVNNLCYDKKGKIYITDSINNGYYTIDINNLTFNNLKHIDTEFYINDIGLQNNKIIARSNLKIIDLENNTICNFTLPKNIGRTSQSTNLFDNYFSVNYSNPNVSLLYDYKGNYIRTINYGEVINSSIPMGEFEGYCILNDKKTCIGISQYYYTGSYNHNERFCQLFTFNLNNSIIRTNHSLYNIGTNTIFINKNYNGEQNGSEDKPFSNINDAIYYLQNSRLSNINVNIKEGNYDEIIDIRSLGNKTIYLNAENNTQISNMIIYSGNIVCNNITFTGNKYDEVKQLLNEEPYCIHCYSRCSLKLLNCNFTPNTHVGLIYTNDSNIIGRTLNTTICNITPNINITGSSTGTIAFSSGTPSIYFTTTSFIKCRGVNFITHKNSNYSVLYSEKIGVGNFTIDNISDGCDIQINTLYNSIRLSGSLNKTITIPIISPSTDKLYIGLLTVTIDNNTWTISAQKWTFDETWSHIVYQNNDEAISGNVYLTSVIAIEQ